MSWPKISLLAATLVLLVGIAPWVCAGPQTEETVFVPGVENIPCTHPVTATETGRFQFAIVADRTGGHRPGVFAKAIKQLNLLQPTFVMSIGDFIEGNTEDEATLNAQWDEFDGLVGTLEMPFFYVPGNHDISNAVMERTWRERHGRPYYHFLYDGVLFVCLSTEDPPETHISDEQIQYMAKALAANPTARWTLVFMHKPLWVMEEEVKEEDPTATTGWPKIEALLADRPHTVFAGHHHRYSHAERNGQDCFVLATTGGFSDLGGPQAGQFDHIAWVTMTDNGPRVANVMLDGIYDEDITVDDAKTGQND